MEKENIKSPIQAEDIIEEKIKETAPNVHVVRQRIDVCVMCGKERDLRMGWCWDCAEAQNILATGLDMYASDEDEEKAVKFPIKEVNERLKLLINKGWRTGK